MRAHRKGKPRVHAPRIETHRQIDELTNAGKGCDGIEALGDLRPREAEHGGVQPDVFPTGKMRVETGTEFEQCRNAAFHTYRPCCGPKRTAEKPQQRRLARTVLAHDAERFSAAQLKIHIPERPKFFRCGADERMSARGSQPIGFAQPARFDHNVLRAHGEAASRRASVNGKFSSAGGPTGRSETPRMAIFARPFDGCGDWMYRNSFSARCWRSAGIPALRSKTKLSSAYAPLER